MSCNLLFDLRQLTARPIPIAESLAALIDGVYLRAALNETGNRETAAAQVSDALDMFLHAQR